MSNREKDALRERLKEETYKKWLNQQPIQFPLPPDSSIRNDYSNSSSLSEVGNGGNQIQVGMDDYLQDTTYMEAMLLDAFQNDELGDDDHITNTLFESLKFASTTPYFGPGGKSKSTQLGQRCFCTN